MASRRRVTWTREALRTLDEVLEYIARDSAEGAGRVLEQALSAAASLATLADRGRVVPELTNTAVREIFVYAIGSCTAYRRARLRSSPSSTGQGTSNVGDKIPEPSCLAA